MRVVGRFKDKDIRLDSFHMSETYGTFLLGPSEKRMEESNIDILKNLEGRICDRVFGSGYPVHIAGKDGLDLKKRLPAVYVLAWLSCGSKVQDPDSDGSHLILIWFQDADVDPFVRAYSLVSSLDWAKYSKDFQY